MRLSFGASKFLTMLFAGTLTALASYFVVLCDAFVLGNVIGEDALAGVNMVIPALSMVSFVASMIAVGTETNFLISIGKNDHDRACRFFTQGLWTALVAGLCMSAAMYLFGDVYIASMDGSEYVVMYAEQYMQWAWPVPFVQCFFMLLASICFADGDLRICSLGLIVALSVKVVASYFLADSLGMGASAGALGSIAAMVSGVFVLCGHFFRKTNTVRPVWHFSMKDTLRLFSSSFADRAIFLCNSVLFFLLVKTVNDRFGSDMLPVASLAIALWNLMHVFGGVGFAAQPVVAVYHGEGNNRAIWLVMRLALCVALAEGVLFTVFVLVFPEAVIWFTGLEYPDLVSSAFVCLRLLCIGMVALSMSFLLKAYFLYIERPYISFAIAVITHATMPVICMRIGAEFGFAGVWVGMAVGPILGLAIVLVMLLAVGGKSNFPFLIPRVSNRKVVMFSLVLEEDEITKISRAIAKTIEHELAGVRSEDELSSVAMRAALIVEEVFMVVRERNVGRRKLLGEVTLDLNDGIMLTLRDDGVIFDITDADARISSFRSFLVASVMEKQRFRLNLLTTGFNRNVFRF